MSLKSRLEKLEASVNPPPDRNPCAGLAAFMRAAHLRWSGADVALPPAPPAFITALRKMRQRAARQQTQDERTST